MRILRTVMVSPMPELERIAVVVRDIDMKVPLEEVGASNDFGFTYEHVFEMPDDTTIEQATIEAERQADPEGERNMAILYYWTYAQFGWLKDGGTIISPKPAPLSEEQIRHVWNLLSAHPDYRNFNFQTTTKDGRPIAHKEIIP